MGDLQQAGLCVIAKTPRTANQGADNAAWPGWATALLGAALIGAMVLIAYAGRLLVDDAFISFRYARNFVEGAGLVYNAGERVEGYTNFLWVMLIAAGMWLGFEPGSVAHPLGLAFYAGTLGFMWRMSQQVLTDARWSAVVLLLVGTQFSVFTFATGGLETSLQTCLLAAACALIIECDAIRAWRLHSLIALSVICAAGMLTRMDFALFAAVLIPAALVSARSTRAKGANGTVTPLLHQLLALALPAGAIVGTWLAWKWSYYGAILPNTYYAKRPGPGSVAVGLAYLRDFFTTYLYALPGAFVLIGAIALLRRRHILLIAPCIISLWLAYLVRVGGDFIEFRMLVPIMPLFMLTLVWTLRWLNVVVPIMRQAFFHVIVIAWTIVGSIWHMNTYGLDPDRPEPIAQLAYQTEGAGWIEAGKALQVYFPNGDVRIATSAAGTLPYYAQLPTIDIQGLTDREVARQSEVVSARPGHQRLASLDYLRKRKVNLVIGHPWPIPADSTETFMSSDLESFAKARRIPDGAVITFIPISGELLLPVWYMTPHPAVDAAIEERGWLTIVIDNDTPPPT
jgi:arabinofuranosyltransferase